jgi:hypothetical protein
MTCDHARRLIAHAAEDPAFGDPTLDSHLKGCERCRAELASQRLVAAWLRGRPAEQPSPGLAARVAARLDAQHAADGFLGLANWRAWGGGLAPLAAGLALAAWLGAGVGLDWEDDDAAASESFASWTHAGAGDDRAALFLQPDVSRDLLLETVLTGALPQDAGDPDVR